MKLTDIIHPEAVVVSLQASERDEVIRELVAGLVSAGAVEPDAAEDIATSIIKREKIGSTGLGKGVAVPHVKHPRVTRLVGTVGLSTAGVNFESLDHKPVFSVFMLLSPKGQDAQHLSAMEAVFRQLNKDLFRKFLRQSTTKQQLLDLLADADAGR
jgi:nitrogen PTS system EIIA component